MEQPRAQRPSPAPLVGPEPLLHGLRPRRGSVFRHQAPGGVSPLSRASAWAADAAEEPAARRAAQRLNGGRELRCVDAAARAKQPSSSPTRFDYQSKCVGDEDGCSEEE
ncbi:hypothetical protein NDU88_002493 [Pleurodeles waltl]|uniref:Uncharacterized protein n=1 Tax=Pleurodeles waltl TaxID=8319 RepID=A0AAV7NFL4_PLEWA|nr:hypothetical protein NDU88_002493 [Pleurodeles waltl]